jgi:hypothetical protein
LFFVQQKSLAQTLDQNQPTWNGGTSERNLPGYYEWQSFTAGLNGYLCRIDLMFCNTNVKVNGTGTLKVYTGQGTAGTLLLTQSVSANGTAYNFNQPFWQSWNLNTTPAITTGSLYTFQFIPTQGGGLTDPYLIQINIPSIYSNGQNYNLGTLGDCAFKTYVNTSLPVELLSFTGQKLNDIIKLDWSTASEINNDYFSVERSSDGNYFSEIGKVNGGGSSSELLNYSFEDNHPVDGINYYRLKQVDFNGDYMFSKVITMNYQSEFSGYTIRYDNDGYFILNCRSLHDITINIMDMRGSILKTIEADNKQGEINISLKNFPGGIYLLSIYTGKDHKYFKLQKN